jgi:GNAT superfamily N-acetyltransferase
MGPVGVATRAALWLPERLIDLEVDAQYTARLDAVAAALAEVEEAGGPKLRVLSGRKKRLELVDRLRALQSSFPFEDLSQIDRLVLAEEGEHLLAYWCFQRREGNLYDRGVFVSPKARGLRLAARLLRRAVEAEGTPSAEAKLIASVGFSNRGSRRMLERCGLQLDGVLTKGHLPGLGDFHFFFRPLG